MEHSVVARLTFGPSETAVKARRLTGLARLQSDSADAPFGQWTLCAELWDDPGPSKTVMAWIQLASPKAPALSEELRFSLFQGTQQVAEVLVSWVEGQRHLHGTDRDILADPTATFRSVEA